VILVSFSVLGLMFRRHNRRSAEAGQRLSQSYGGVATAINESLNGFVVVKTRCAVDQAVKRIDDNAAGMASAAVTYARVSGLSGERAATAFDGGVADRLLCRGGGTGHAAGGAGGFRLCLDPAGAGGQQDRLGAGCHHRRLPFLPCAARAAGTGAPENLVEDGEIFTGLKSGLQFDRVSFHYEGPEIKPRARSGLLLHSERRNHRDRGRSGAGKST